MRHPCRVHAGFDVFFCLKVARVRVAKAVKAGIPMWGSKFGLDVLLCMQVATARVAKAVKAEIPCVDDPVSKLEDIGEKTSKKLQDVQSAAESAGVCDVSFPDRSITTGAAHPRLQCKLVCSLAEHVVVVCVNVLRDRLRLPLCWLLQCLLYSRSRHSRT